MGKRGPLQGQADGQPAVCGTSERTGRCPKCQVEIPEQTSQLPEASVSSDQAAK